MNTYFRDLNLLTKYKVELLVLTSHSFSFLFCLFD